MSPRILPALGLLGLLSGCGEGPRLEGSVTPLLDLRYETVTALADEDEASVSFLTVQGSGENTVLKVAARLDRLPIPRGTTVLAAGTELDLAELMGDAPDAPQRGAVSRSVLDEPERDFPRILRGGLTFEKQLDLENGFPAGTKVPGDFHVTFVNGTDVYSGRTIFGRFEATVP